MADAKIRPYRTGDAPALADIFRRSVEGVGPRDYRPDQVAAWASRAADIDAVRTRCEDGRMVWVAVDSGDRPIAYIDLEADGHLDHLYAAPEAAGQGVATALYQELEGYARSEGITCIYVEASEAAKRFFSRCGFMVVKRSDFEVSGVPMTTTAWRKNCAKVRPQSSSYRGMQSKVSS